jgi:hypothetical protein
VTDDKEVYEEPTVTVLGEITDMTQKHGPYFDYGFATEGQSTVPPPGPGNTYS